MYLPKVQRMLPLSQVHRGAKDKHGVRHRCTRCNGVVIDHCVYMQNIEIMD